MASIFLIRLLFLHLYFSFVFSNSIVNFSKKKLLQPKILLMGQFPYLFFYYGWGPFSSLIIFWRGTQYQKFSGTIQRTVIIQTLFHGSQIILHFFWHGWVSPAHGKLHQVFFKPSKNLSQVEQSLTWGWATVKQYLHILIKHLRYFFVAIYFITQFD